MKVYVYAICKNESKFAKRWMESMSEADGVYVLDTGSEDDTVQLLREAGAVVEIQEFKPWRFDTARNRSLEMVPEDADVCVCTDLDELFHPGWRALLEAAWKPDTTRAAYRYTWNFNPDGSEGFVFWLNNMHERRGYRWTHPVHEVLERTDGLYTSQIYIEGIQLDHHADDTKPRSQYHHCSRCLWPSVRMTTETCTIWAGNTIFTAAGRMLSAPSSIISKCPARPGRMNAARPCDILPAVRMPWGGKMKQNAGSGAQ